MSRQQDAYLEMRGLGSPMEVAACCSGIPLPEARLLEQAIAAGDLEIPAAGSAAIRPELNMPKKDPPTTDFELEALISVTADTLRGDARDSMIAWFKAQPKAWGDMSEAEQRSLVEAVDSWSWQLVRNVCEVVAKGERPAIVAKLVEYKEKDGVEAKLKFGSSGDVVAALHEAVGREVLLVATGLEQFSGEQGEASAQVDPDQRDLLGVGAEYADESAR